MRPRKKVLLMSVSEDRLRELRYTLHVKGFAVIGAEASAEAMERLEADAPDLLLVDWPAAGCEAAIECAHGLHVPSLVLAREGKRTPPDCLADATMLGPVKAAEWLEMVRVMVARKRGPRPKGSTAAREPVAANAWGSRVA